MIDQVRINNKLQLPTTSSDKMIHSARKHVVKWTTHGKWRLLCHQVHHLWQVVFRLHNTFMPPWRELTKESQNCRLNPQTQSSMVSSNLMHVRYVCLIQSLVLIGNLYVNGVWLDLDLRRTPKDTHLKEIRLGVHNMLVILSFVINFIGGLQTIGQEIRPNFLKINLIVNQKFM